MTKTIKIDVYTLIGVAIGVTLIATALTIGTVAYYNYKNKECVSDPVAYANNNSEDYWWDFVQPINTRYIKQYGG